MWCMHALMLLCVHIHVLLVRGSRSLQNVVAIFQRYNWPVLTSIAGCIGKDGNNWLLNPETSSRSEGYSSKWLIWLVCGEPLLVSCYYVGVCCDGWWAWRLVADGSSEYSGRPSLSPLLPGNHWKANTDICHSAVGCVIRLIMILLVHTYRVSAKSLL